MALPNINILNEMIDSLFGEKEKVEDKPEEKEEPSLTVSSGEFNESLSAWVLDDVISVNKIFDGCTTLDANTFTYASSTSYGITPWSIVDEETEETITQNDLFEMKEELEILKNIVQENDELKKLYKAERVIRKLRDDK